MAQNILVTGSSGFIGSKLKNALEKLGHRVFSFDKRDNLDICEQKDFEKFSDKNITVVYHLAGATFVPESWKNPNKYYSINTMGTQNVLDFCVRTGAKLIYTSAYIYGVPEYFPIDEKHPLKANNPYAHSKLLAEQLCRFYSENYDVKTIIIRPFNIYGVGQNEDFLIPTLINQLKSGKITVKNLNTKRDYVNVKDLITAYIKCLDYDKNNIFNVGSGNSYSVGEVIELFKSISSLSFEVENLNEQRKNEIPDTIADLTNIKKELNWEPKICLKEGLAEIVK